MRIATFHSFKGGTGKTSLAVNVAVSLAKKGKNVALVDFDLPAPSFQSYFTDEEVYFSDFLLGTTSIESVFRNLKEDLETDGNLYVALTSFDFLKRQSQKVAHLQGKDQSITVKLIEAVKFLEDKVDILFIDAMPGASYRSLDALLISDTIITVVVPQQSFVYGLHELCKNVYTPLADTAKMHLVVNQIESKEDGNADDKIKIQGVTSELKELLEIQKFDYSILAEIERIPYLSERIYPLIEQQNHPFIQSIQPIVAEFL